MLSSADILAKYDIRLATTRPGRHYTTCPQCSAARSSNEHRAAKVLGVTIEMDGSTRWGCSHCSWHGPEKGSSGERRELQAYVYRDANGTPQFRKVRNLPGHHQPRFWLERADGGGDWLKGTKGVDTKILYRLDEVTKAIAEGRTVCCVEGEKDVDSVSAMGIAATCNAHGASEPGKNPKWTRAHSEQLAGADLVVLNDNDAAGYEHADATCKLSLGIAKRIRRLDLAPHWPEIPKGGDVSDWLAAGHTREQLEALIEAAPDYAPAAADSTDKPTNATDDDAEIERLAKLPLLDYERARKDCAKQLGTRPAMLDAVVKAKRAELGLNEGDNKQGHAIEFAAPETWPEPVEGSALLDDIAATVRRYVVMADHEQHAVALWVAHTYLLDRMMITPRLGIRSPVKGCGKTTLLDVVGQLVLRPLSAANVSASAIFRVIESHRPCLLIDEADSFLRDNEELRGVLNAGHRRGGSVVRNVGDDHEPRAFSTYGACAIALIGSLPGTLTDRSVLIDLTRRKTDEAIEPFRFDRVGHLVELQRKLLRWTVDNAEAIAATEPEMPAGLYNRAADNWRPLLAIAAVAGGAWLARGHQAALQGAGAEVDEQSWLELLLSDVRDIFGRLEMDRIPSVRLIERLVEIEPRPWAEYGKGGKPITQNKLARLLKPVGITAQKIRIGTETPRGYYCHQFEEAFDRYLPPSKVEQWNKCDEHCTSEPFQSGTADPMFHFENGGKSNNDGLCSTVPLRKGEKGEEAPFSAESGEQPPPVCEHCGAPEHPGNPVQQCAVDGLTHMLHRNCQRAWLDG